MNASREVDGYFPLTRGQELPVMEDEGVDLLLNLEIAVGDTDAQVTVQ